MLRFFILIPLLATLSAQEFQISAIAAKVNGNAITEKEVDILLAPRREILLAMYPRKGETYEERLKGFHDRVLEQLINNKLLLSEVEGKASIPDQIVDQEVARIIRENYDGSDEEFHAFLLESGLTRQSFREKQREQILIQAFRSQQFSQEPPPTESEISAKYEERKTSIRDRTKDSIDFRKIFIVARDRLDPNVTPESQLVLAEKIHQELEGGADFIELAKKHSNGAFASEGGLWEKSKRTDFSLAFGDTLFEESKDGDLVGPLKDPAGFTIVKIIKIHYGPSPPLSEEGVYKRMKREVNIEKRSGKYEKWIKSLKEHAMIEIFE